MAGEYGWRPLTIKREAVRPMPRKSPRLAGEPIHENKALTPNRQHADTKASAAIFPDFEPLPS